ncbi:sortase (surface protein transpeptidase) [Crossiella equi]|uniref:Sortase (Surface protein transpeptidase) n=1 Tax=Crossiella equi TaxID=130796 RepID=A0ABS5AI43_9PSEU|nr:class F sortase [Crossiella equi]MBP2475899.1 sortase (surface protein transpeptidase) [Crossiella equi]
MSSKRTGGRALAAVLLLGTVLLGACGGGEPAAQSPAPAVSSSATAAAGNTKLKPTDVRIPKIAAESSLISTAINPDGTLEVPKADKPMQAAWYRMSPVPGDKGPAIILGHVDGNKQPGIFYKLHELAPGDEIFVKRSDGKEVKFVVATKEQQPKEQFPTEAVYGDTTDPVLRLITCGGAFDKAAHSYKDNVIISAKLA